jgi:alanyl-tRNA synthetase
MTERLYYTDSYIQEFDAEVLDRAGNSQRIYLDRSAFYPTSGGQPFDTGELAGVQVMDVIDEGERVAHLLAGPLANDRVTGRVNWTRRFDHMQQHTGQHLLSAVVADRFGYQTVAVHFGKESSTLDLDTASLTADQAGQIEEHANNIITQNRPVEISFEEAELATGLRKAPARSGKLRIISIADLDRSACGGTHVRATGEVGVVLVRKVERVRKGIRLEFLCGARAVRRAASDHALLSQLALDLSAAPEEIPRLIGAQRDELKRAAATVKDVEGKLDLFKARELYTGATPETTGIRRVVVRHDEGSLDELRGVALAFTSLPKTIFVGVVSSPPAVLLATCEDSGIDAAGMLKSLVTCVGGRGGGSARLAQGIVPGRAQLDKVVESLGSRV